MCDYVKKERGGATGGKAVYGENSHRVHASWSFLCMAGHGLCIAHAAWQQEPRSNSRWQAGVSSAPPFLPTHSQRRSSA